jgi:ribosomal protein S18 acetylase RimI-like enzyme
MNEAVYAAYKESTIASFAHEQVTAQLWNAHDALGQARADFYTMLPQGLGTSDNYLYEIHGPGETGAVGTLWFAEKRQGERRIAYVYDVLIRPEHQRKGYATQAFVELQRHLVALGFHEIALQVFAHNMNAQNLYRKLGFEVKRISLVKPLL